MVSPRARLAVGFLAAAALLACGNEETDKRLDSLDERLSAIEGRLENIELWVKYLGRAEREAEEGGGGGGAADRLADLDRRLGTLEKSIDRGAARPDPLHRDPIGARRPGRPDPDAVYAVPIADAPFEGREHAKVTLVEFTDYQ